MIITKLNLSYDKGCYLCKKFKHSCAGRNPLIFPCTDKKIGVSFDKFCDNLFLEDMGYNAKKNGVFVVVIQEIDDAKRCIDVRKIYSNNCMDILKKTNALVRNYETRYAIQNAPISSLVLSNDFYSLDIRVANNKEYFFKSDMCRKDLLKDIDLKGVKTL